MAHVSLSQITDNLQQVGLSFQHRPQPKIDVGPNRTFEWTDHTQGAAIPFTFNIHGSKPYVGAVSGHATATAHLIVDDPLDFVPKAINLHPYSDILLKNFNADSYTYQNGQLTFYGGGLTEYGMHIKEDPGANLWVFHASTPDGHSALRISTEIRSPGEGEMFALPIHTF